MNNKEVVKKIRKIFTRINSLNYSCYIDSLVRIDEELYDCNKCISANSVSIRREDMLGKGMYPLCPLEMKVDVKELK